MITTIVDYTEPPQWALAIAAIAAHQCMSVRIVRSAPGIRKIQVFDTYQGLVIGETTIVSEERQPSIDALFAWRKMLGVEMDGGE